MAVHILSDGSVCPHHHCHAPGCTKHVKPEFLMCRAHWLSVPKQIRDRVWDTYNPGQCDGQAPVTREWHEAADAAIQAVAKKEEQS